MVITPYGTAGTGFWASRKWAPPARATIPGETDLTSQGERHGDDAIGTDNLVKHTDPTEPSKGTGDLCGAAKAVETTPRSGTGRLVIYTAGFRDTKGTGNLWEILCKNSSISCVTWV